MISRGVALGVVAGALLLAQSVRAEVVIEWVTVGDVGNTADDKVMGDGTTGYGRVDYEYRIGKYEVTNGQYIEFLNAVAAADPYGLYHWLMNGTFGGIARYGDPGGYTYGPKQGDTNWLSKPVSLVSWYDAHRFANWMHNGQPSGMQDPSTTEDGAYDLSRGTNLVRKEGANVFLPSEDEWYKAAYYKGGTASAGYWDYATQSDTIPVAEEPPGRSTTPGSANYWVDEDAVGAPYYSSDVGAYTALPSESAYGTFDQNGNMWEWNEALIDSYGGIRGGSWGSDAPTLHASDRFHAAMEYYYVGFRLASRAKDDGCDGWGTLADYGSLASCLSGPGVVAPKGCTCGDHDGDEDVDLADFAMFQRIFAGP